MTQPESEFSHHRVFRAAGLDPPAPAVIADSVPARLALVARGRFLTISSEPTLRFTGYDKVLKALPLHLPSVLDDIGVVILKNRTLTSAAQLFIDCAHEVANDLPPRKQKRFAR